MVAMEVSHHGSYGGITLSEMWFFLLISMGTS